MSESIGHEPVPIERLTPRPHRDSHDIVTIGLLIVFLIFFFVGEKIETLALPVRIEDFIFILLIPFSYRYLARPKSKLFYWIVAYFAVNLIPYLAAALAGQYALSFYPIIMIKEMQYFYIAYLICELRSRVVFGTVDALAILIVANGLRAIYQGEISYYGIGTFGSSNAPSLVGALYLFSTIWLHIRSKLITDRALRWWARLFVMLGFVCVVATVSRSSIAAMVVYVATYLLLTNLKMLPFFLAGLGLSTKAIQIAALLFSTGVGAIAARIVGRAELIGSAAVERSGKWEYYLSSFQPMDFVFGMGKGYPNAIEARLGLGVDSQYIRTIMENGFIGIAIVLVIFWKMLETIRRRGGEFEHAWAVVLAMLVMSVPLEALQVSKSGGFFWLTMLYLLMCQRRIPAGRRLR